VCELVRVRARVCVFVCERTCAARTVQLTYLVCASQPFRRACECAYVLCWRPRTHLTWHMYALAMLPMQILAFTLPALRPLSLMSGLSISAKDPGKFTRHLLMYLQ
jgi:hypothetical protein